MILRLSVVMDEMFVDFFKGNVLKGGSKSIHTKTVMRN